MAVDEARYQQLIEKRDGPGLSDEEANELGKLMAEKEGVAYGKGGEKADMSAEELREWERVAGHRDQGIDEDAERVNAIYEAQTGQIEEGGGTPGIQE